MKLACMPGALRAVFLMVAGLALVAPGRASTQQPGERPTPLECGDYLAFQIFLDRHHYSPGLIDGKPGPNLARALTAFQTARSLQPTGTADCATWQALGGDTSQALVSYRIAEADVMGPFAAAIPPELPDQAKLPALAYRSVIEMLAERFHTSPAMLRELNPDARFTAGSEVQVPAVEPFHADAKVKPANDPAAVAITVTRDESALRVTDAAGILVFFAPVTTGSEHDPLPPGDWAVTGVSWMPSFNYNPDLFWDAEPGHAKAVIKPGPNNPVGVVWIDLNVDHYGIHGTPEPAAVGHAESHGCVRLTNWDAARLASMAGQGTPVYFR